MLTSGLALWLAARAQCWFESRAGIEIDDYASKMKKKGS